MLTCNPRLIFEDDLRSATLHYTVNQCPQWACWQYGHFGGAQGWLGVERCQLCVQDTSRSTKWHRRVAVGSLGFHNELSLCVKCCKMVGSVPRWQLSLSGPIQSDHLSIAVCDDTAFWAGTLALCEDWCSIKKGRWENIKYLILIWKALVVRLCIVRALDF